jgi:hypothetical protein
MGGNSTGRQKRPKEEAEQSEMQHSTDYGSVMVAAPARVPHTTRAAVLLKKRGGGRCPGI